MIKEVVKHKLQSLRIKHSGIKQTVNRVIRNIFFDTKDLTKKNLSEHLYKLTHLQTLFPNTKPVTSCTIQKQQIRIGYLNINGKARERINNHYKKLFNLIHNVQCQILTIADTRTKNPPRKCGPNYSLIMKTNPKKIGNSKYAKYIGGVAVYVHDSIKNIVEVVGKRVKHDICHFRLFAPGQKHNDIFACYCRQAAYKNLNVEFFKELSKRVKSTNNIERTMCIGDFNSKIKETGEKTRNANSPLMREFLVDDIRMDVANGNRCLAGMD